MKPVIVLSLGGSLVVPGEIDVKFLRRFIALIKKESRHRRFIIVVGGGKTCRKYQEALSRIINADYDKLDWMGIYTTRVNARLLQLALGNLAHSDIVKDPTKKVAFKPPILVASGYKPGWSTDYVAVLLAKIYGAKKVINLFDVDYVYDRDPKKYKDAKFFKALGWKQYFRIIGRKRIPGSHLPFDPVAARLAQKFGIEVDIANGAKLGNLILILHDKNFLGTKIS